MHRVERSKILAQAQHRSICYTHYRAIFFAPLQLSFYQQPSGAVFVPKE